MDIKTLDHIDDTIDEALRHPTVSPRQVGPRQDVELEDNFDRRQLVRELIAQHPDATADDLARLLEERKIKVSSTLVLQELQRRQSGHQAGA
jgi:hypothetical protein